jgi:valyl-tRNA synthetase
MIRDDLGRVMSKSLGNGVDPLDAIETYGADALRFNIITGNSPGNDMRFYPERCEAMRNFANKIWNASRFVLMNNPRGGENLRGRENPLLSCQLELEDKWILSKLNTLAGEVCENLDKYELGIAAAKIYDFIWDTYCDWYIELTKPRLQSIDKADDDAQSAQNVLLYVLKEILTLLHPFMPFITEEIWQALPHGESGADSPVLMVRDYPKFVDTLHFPKEEADFESIMAAVRAVRSRRAEMNVPPSKKSSLIIVTEKPEVFETGRLYIGRLAYASELTITPDTPTDISSLVTVATNDARLYMPLAELVDVEKEKERIKKEIGKVKADIERVEQKLSNEQFTSKAPEKVVKAEQEKLKKLQALLENLKE